MQEFGPQIKPSGTILGPNSKSFKDFHLWDPLRELGIFG